jgi:thymidylate synthase
MEQYIKLIETVLETGVTKTDRTGVGTRGIFGYETRFDLRKGFPLVTVKKTNFAAIAHELLWFIKGDTNIRYLVQNGVNIWNDWPLKRLNKKQREHGLAEFSEQEFIDHILHVGDFAEIEGDLGPVYGKQWRKWGENSTIDTFPAIDQLADVIKTIRENPDSRRMIVTAWNPTELPDMALPACHAFFQFNCEPIPLKERENIWSKIPRHLRSTPSSHKFGGSEEEEHQDYDDRNIPKHYLSLKLTQRSADIMLGVPFNIASYALLLEMVAKVTNTVAKELIYSLGDAHIYSNHIEAAEKLLTMPSYPLPKVTLGEEVFPDGMAKATWFPDIDGFTFDDIKLLNYQHGPYVKLPVAV